MATFERGTHCPEIHIGFMPLDAPVARTQLHFNRGGLSFNETPQELARLLCVWTRKINGARGDYGYIRRINLLLQGETNEEAKEKKEDTKKQEKP